MTKNARLDPASLKVADYQTFESVDPHSDILKLTTEGFTGTGRSDRSPIIFRLPFDWHGTDSHDRNWMFQLQAWRMLDPYLVASAQDENPDQFNYCLAVMKDWIRDNIVAPPGQYTWYDMSTGIRASKIALMKRVSTKHQVDTSEISGFDMTVDAHFEHLMNPKELSLGNHGLFQMWGLKSLSSAISNHKYAQEAKSYAVAQMTRLIVSQMGRLGVHTENSPQYHFFASQQINSILRSADWDIPEMAPAFRLMERAENVKPWLVDTNNRVVPVGDSARRRIKPDEHRDLSSWPHKSDKRYIGATLDGYGVIRSRPEVPRSRSSYLFMNAAFHSKVHKHDDCLSVFWQEGGKDILIDPGKYSYQDDSYRKFFVSRRAHNTVEFDGGPGVSVSGKRYGSGIKEIKRIGQGTWQMTASAPCSSAGDMHNRKIVYQPGRGLLVFDRIVPLSEKVHQYNLWWHFSHDGFLQSDIKGCRVVGISGEKSLSVRYSCNANPFQVSFFRGDTNPELQGWSSPDYMKYEPSPALKLHTSAAGSFHSVTVFVWDEGLHAAIEPTLSEGERKLVLAATA